jgi:hypothetical protein
MAVLALLETSLPSRKTLPAASSVLPDLGGKVV